MRLFVSLVISTLLSLSLSAQEVIITGLIDGTQSGTPRALELYVSGTVDLSSYFVARYSNGSNTPQDADVLSGTYTNAFVYVIQNGQGGAFTSAFGTAGDFSNRIFGAQILGTGDDVFVLQQGATIVDQVGGDIGTTFNTYQDSWLYRNDNTGPDGAWVPANWQNVGNTDALDGLTFAQMGAAVPFGTYSTLPPSPTVSVTGLQDGTEDGQSAQFTFTASPGATNSISVVYTYSGTATEGEDFVDAAYDDQTMRGTITFQGGSTVLTLPVNDDALVEGLEQIELTLISVSDATYTVSPNTATVNVIDNEAQPATLISAIQGDGFTTPLLGLEVTVEAVVVGDFQGGTGVGLGGFFVQEEDADQDGNPLTSEGLFIFENGTAPDVTVGDLVRITGTATEFSGGTQINATSGSVTVVGAASLPTAATVDFPIADDGDLEKVEGMLANVVDPMTVTSNFDLGRFGSIEVSEDGRLIQFTECNTPNSNAVGPYNDALAKRSLIIDDGRSGNNVFPIVILDGLTIDANSTLRSGAVLSGLTGILDDRFNDYRLQPTATPTITNNDRPFLPPSVGGNVKVASMNVLNYFNGDGQGGGFPTSRGADNLAEFQRQEAKIVSAICALDADIIGLVEIENDGYGANSALQSLVNAISTSCGVTYDFVESPNSGGDAIQVALIYNTATVTESGTAAALATPSDVFNRNRVPVAQTFRVIESGNPNFGQSVTVCVNHFKSKGGSCGTGDDETDGSGSCNGTRDAAAQAISAWLATDPTNTGEEDILIVGDLNAYRMEDPIETILNAGYVNTVVQQQPAGSFPCGGSPSYVFRSQWGSLDYILASTPLSLKVTGADSWNVNSPEPTALDYNTEDNDASLYQDDAFRFSDHDPILVGLNLGMPLPVELTDLRGRAEDKTVVLDWTTTTEVGSDRFEVQRRTVGGTFSVVGTITAAGNSSAPLDYQFIDEQPATGANDYRLRAIDLDGSSALSSIVSVTFSAAAAVTVQRAGPRQYQLLNAPAGTRFLLTDANGRVVRTGTVRSANTLLDGTALPAGVYFVVINDEVDGQVFRVLME